MNTSGVRIAFVTDSISLRLSGSCGRVSREIYSFDVTVGNELITMKPDSAKPETFKPDSLIGNVIITAAASY